MEIRASSLFICNSFKMGFFVADTLSELCFLVFVVVVFATNFFLQSYKYWAKKGVPAIQPKFPLGNTNIFLPKGLSVGTLSQEFYNEFKSKGHKFGGVYLVTEPNLVVVDPEYVKDILLKDFQYFVDRGFYYNEKDDPISAHLFALDGSKWRNLRVKLTPTFTSGKMKMMFQTVVDCCENMIEALDQNLGKDIEIKEFLGRFTTDVIGSCAFGIECNSFKHPDAEFRVMGKQIFQYNFWGSFKAFISMNLPKLSLKLGITSVTKEVDSFFRGMVTDTVRMRNSKGIRRNDFLQILIDLQESADLSLDEIVAQVFLFFAAGFETSSTTMTFALYELAKNSEIQKKLRTEVLQVLEQHEDKITYEGITEMKYLAQVVDETLRKYPPLPTLNRRCIKEYTLRDTNVVIEEGTPILISALGLHMDPEYYPDPEQFDPERFSEQNKKNRHQFAHLPFGDGPRNCIGLRFGLMQTKIGIAKIIKDFKVSVSLKNKPVILDPYTFMLNTLHQVILKLEKV